MQPKGDDSQEILQNIENLTIKKLIKQGPYSDLYDGNYREQDNIIQVKIEIHFSKQKLISIFSDTETPQIFQKFKNQYQAANSLNHQNILKIYLAKELVKDERYAFIFENWDFDLESFTQGEMQSQELLNICWQLIISIKYFHEIAKIIHMNLSLTTIYLKLVNGEYIVKISHFENFIPFSTRLDEEKSNNIFEQFFQDCESGRKMLQFAPLEFLQSPHQIKQSHDMWSLGVIFFALFFQQLPFVSNIKKTSQDMRQKIEDDSLLFQNADIEIGTDSQKMMIRHLIRNLLNKEQDRYNVKQVISHRLFNEEHEEEMFSFETMRTKKMPRFNEKQPEAQERTCSLFVVTGMLKKKEGIVCSPEHFFYVKKDSLNRSHCKDNLMKKQMNFILEQQYSQIMLNRHLYENQPELQGIQLKRQITSSFEKKSITKRASISEAKLVLQKKGQSQNNYSAVLIIEAFDMYDRKGQIKDQTKFAVFPSQEVQIGRNQTNLIKFQEDAQLVSRLHVQIQGNKFRYLIRDMTQQDQYNQYFFRVTEKQLLEQNQVILVGDTTAKIVFCKVERYDVQASIQLADLRSVVSESDLKEAYRETIEVAQGESIILGKKKKFFRDDKVIEENSFKISLEGNKIYIEDCDSKFGLWMRAKAGQFDEIDEYLQFKILYSEKYLHQHFRCKIEHLEDLVLDNIKKNDTCICGCGQVTDSITFPCCHAACNYNCCFQDKKCKICDGEVQYVCFISNDAFRKK